MTKEAIIKKTTATLNMLPVDKAEEVADFADYILRKYDEVILQDGVEKLTSQAEAFKFLDGEEDIYTIDDIIKK